MYSPKRDIYQALKELNAFVVQSSQNIFTHTPAITFAISNNSTNLDLDNQISSQEITVVVDIWTESSEKATTLLGETETIMRNKGYCLTYSADVPRPDGALHHINCRFETVK